MSQAIVDPAELRRFAHNLKRFSQDLELTMNGLHGQMLTLGESWRDQEHDKFVQEFEHTLKMLHHFMEAANLHVPLLVHKAERIEEYLQQRGALRSRVMEAGAGVSSFAALHAWYAALAEFRVEAQDALTSMSLSLQRAADWLVEQQEYWRRQIRVCEEQVTQAKAELENRRYTDFSGHISDCTVQEKNLRRAQARLQAAEDRLAAVHRWMQRLPKEICAVYDGPANHLAMFLESDLPTGLALLGRQLTALEKYANLQTDAVAAQPQGEQS